MASLVLSGDTSGSITVSAPAVAGSTTQTLVNVTGTLAPIVSGTAITLTNQTAPDLNTAIPSWVKRITVIFSGVSTNGTSNYLVQIGSGSYTTSGYLGSAGIAASGNQTAAATFTAGFGIQAGAGTVIVHGVMQIVNVTGNTWVASIAYGRSDNAIGGSGGGSVTLSGVLDRVRLNTVNGTDQFDAGTINLLWE